jgi:inhibitor of cysteine peptidase
LVLFASGGATSQGIELAGVKQAIVVTLMRADDDTTIDVHAGDTIVVRLPENPTTGFTWAIDKVRDNVIRLRSSEYSPASGAGVGGGGVRSLVFEAISAGTVRLQLKHRREWDADQPITDRFAATIRVLPGTLPGEAPKG